MQKIYFLIFLFTFGAFFTHTFAQEKEKKISKKDSLEIKNNSQNSKKMLDENQLENGIKFIQNNITIYEKYNRVESVIEQKFQIGQVYLFRAGNYQKARQIFLSLLNLYEKGKRKKSLNYPKILMNISTTYVYEGDNQSDSIFFYARKGKNYLEKYHPKDRVILVAYSNMIGIFFEGSQENADSVQYYSEIAIEKVQIIKKEYENSKIKFDTSIDFDYARLYFDYGSYLSLKMGQYKNGLTRLLKAQEIAETLPQSDYYKSFIFAINIQTATCYKNIEQIEKCIQLNYKTEKILIDNPKMFIQNENLVSFYTNFGSAYLEYAKKLENKQAENILDSSLYYTQKALNICKDNKGLEYKLSGFIYPNMAEIYRAKNDYEKFYIYTKKILDIANRIYKSKKNIDYAIVYNNFGLYFNHKKNPEEALKMFQKAICAIAYNFDDSTNVEKNPRLAKNMSFANDMMVQLLYSKAKTFSMLDSLKNNKLHVNYSIDALKIGIGLSNFIRLNSIQEDNLAFLRRYSQLYTLIIENYYELGDKKLYFEYLEQYRASMLRAEVSQNENITGINPNLLQQETNIKNDITQIEGQIAQTPADKNLQDKYFQRNLKLDSLVSVFEKMNPEYHSLKYTGEVITLEKTKQKLTENQAVVQYIMADKALYIMVITKNITEIKKIFIEKDSLLDKINVYRDAFKKNSKDEKLVYLSMDLYQILIKDILPLIKDKNHWFIVPDNALFEINFEALFEKLPNTTKYDKNKKIRLADFPWHEVDYILHKHIITMALSATLTFDEKFFKKQEIKNIDDILLVAPVYTNKEKGSLILAKNLDNMKEMRKQEEGDRAGISEDGKHIIELEHSKTEVENIANLFQQKGKKTTILLEENATELNYREKAKSAKIVHLSTHSYFHNRDYRLSAITFWQPDSVVYNQKPNLSDDGMLFGTEVYGMNLSNTNLVVLSSCEGGLGKIIGGEGPMAITRGFMYAGVPNLLYSIYKVGDKHTAELMPYFYKYVLEGKKYSESLNLAKKDFIKAKKGAASLNTWAGFVIMER